MEQKKLITEKDYYYYYQDLIDGCTYKVVGYFIADFTFHICRVSFKNCDFSKRIEVDSETLKEIRKAEKVYARFGFSDKVVTLEDANNNEIDITQDDCFLVGYEDEDGDECEEDGTYLNQ
jgi:hypothetical protein